MEFDINMGIKIEMKGKKTCLPVWELLIYNYCKKDE